jgi:spore coat assembly protein SafA
MKKRFTKAYLGFLITSFVFVIPVFASNMQVDTFDYSVNYGDSIWKICIKHEVGVSDLLSVNPQVSNPDLIYPGQILKVPNLSEIKNLENEVARLVNIERSKEGLSSLKINWQLSRIARYKSCH